MAIQMRRGSFADFDKTKLLPGEFAVVLNGDPLSETGVYVGFNTNNVQRLATTDTAAAMIKDGNAAVVKDLSKQVDDFLANDAPVILKQATDEIESIANAANSTAEEAKQIATQSNGIATRAKELAANAAKDADSANITSNDAYSQSNEALAKSTNALTIANQTKSDFDKIIQGYVVDNSITTTKLADNAVTTPKIKDSSITPAKILDNSIDSSKVTDNFLFELLIDSPLEIRCGGTGASTATQARANLGLGSGATISPSDYIVASGKSGIWAWQKYNSGLAVCFGSTTLNTSITQAWGLMYESASISYPYPFEFETLPSVLPSAHGETSGSVLSVEINGAGGSTTQTPGLFLTRPDAYATVLSYQLNILVYGRYKETA